MTIKFRESPLDIALAAGEALRANGAGNALEAYTPSGTAASLATSKNTTNGSDQTVSAASVVYIPGAYEIESGHSLEIAATACMEIG